MNNQLVLLWLGVVVAGVLLASYNIVDSGRFYTVSVALIILGFFLMFAQYSINYIAQ